MEINLDKKEYYEYNEPKERTRQRLKTLKDLGVVEV